MRLNHYRSIWIAVAAAAIAVSVWLWPSNTQPSSKDTKTMQTFTNHMTTRCVGRFLLDLPNHAIDARGNYGFRIAAMKPVQKADLPVAEVLRRLDRDLAARAAREQGLKNAFGEPILDTQVYQPAAQIRSLRYEDTATGVGQKMDGYVVKAGGTFAFETSALEDKDIKEFHDFLIDVSPALSLRENSTIPTKAGFCIDDGFVALNSNWGEGASFSWMLPGHLDVKFSFSTQSNDDDVRPGHLDRESETVAELGNLMSSIHTLRKRRFELIGMPAQEWSVEFTDQPAFEFRIEIPGSPNDKAKPFITLAMWVGDGQNKIKPSLTKGEALALWDAVIQTLRLRPGAV